MSKKDLEKKEVEKKEMICIFGDEIENKKYELKEVITIIRNKFGKNLEVGKVSYYFLGFKRLKLVEVSYYNMSEIIKRIFELEGLKCETTGKCMAWYNGRMNKGLIDINKDFKSSVRSKIVIDIDSLF